MVHCQPQSQVLKMRGFRNLGLTSAVAWSLRPTRSDSVKFRHEDEQDNDRMDAVEKEERITRVLSTQ